MKIKGKQRRRRRRRRRGRGRRKRRRRRRRKDVTNVKRNEKGKKEGIKEKTQLFESLNLWWWVGSTNLDIAMSLGIVDCSQFCRTFAFLCV